MEPFERIKKGVNGHVLDLSKSMFQLLAVGAVGIGEHVKDALAVAADRFDRVIARQGR